MKVHIDSIKGLEVGLGRNSRAGLVCKDYTLAVPGFGHHAHFTRSFHCPDAARASCCHCHHCQKDGFFHVPASSRCCLLSWVSSWVHLILRKLGKQIFPSQGSNPYPCFGRWCLNHWTIREILTTHFRTGHFTLLYLLPSHFSFSSNAHYLY